MIDLQNIEKKEQARIACLYFAQLNKDDPDYAGSAAKLEKIGQICGGIPSTSMRNYRQSYDAMFDNGRKGWGQNITEEDFLNDNHIDKDTKNVYFKYKNTDLNELKETVNYLLSLKPDTEEVVNMDFFSAFEIILGELKKQKIVVEPNFYDGLIVKKLTSTNTLDANRTSGQTHIAITGNQMDIFPTIESQGYTLSDYQNKDDELKKYYMLQAPIYLYENNIVALSANAKEDFTFKNNKVLTKTTIIRDKRNGQADQLQVSFIEQDGAEFIKFRKLLHVDDYLIFMKKYESFEYDCFGFSNLDTDNSDLDKLNNQFYKVPTHTPVDVLTFKKVESDDENMQNNSQIKQVTAKNLVECNNYIDALKKVSVKYHELYNDDKKLLKAVNKLPESEIVDLLANEYDENRCVNSDGTIKPANVLRRVLLKKLQEGKKITENLIDEIKEKISAGDHLYLDKYFSKKKVIDAIKPLEKNVFRNWQRLFSIFYTFLYRSTEKQSVDNYAEEIKKNIQTDLELDELEVKPWSIKGAQNQGQESIFLAIYPKSCKDPKHAYQIAIYFENGVCSAGIQQGAEANGTHQTKKLKTCNTYEDILNELSTLKDDFVNWNQELIVSRRNTNLIFDTNYKLPSNYAYNRILFGAPGTGKSFTLEEDRKQLLNDNADTNYERVTFHPDYSYANFVGTYKPVPSSEDKKVITYKFVPGPFMRTYVNAIKSARDVDENEEVQPYLLVIEEINRANVAAVFGDVFQLLDRNEKGSSEYPIQTSEDIRNYLVQELGGIPEEYTYIRIPNNMLIWATMNSADQGVFPMDTAFKRRWEFTYLGIDDSETEMKDKTVNVNGLTVEWNKVRKAINKRLSVLNINEDKQLGPYFISKTIIVPKGKEIDINKFNEVFKNKVIMYLFEDAAKQKRSQLFQGCTEDINRYSEICKAYDSKGFEIFGTEFVNELKK